jgi:hypothetical protein
VVWVDECGWPPWSVVPTRFLDHSQHHVGGLGGDRLHYEQILLLFAVVSLASICVFTHWSFRGTVVSLITFRSQPTHASASVPFTLPAFRYTTMRCTYCCAHIDALFLSRFVTAPTLSTCTVHDSNSPFTPSTATHVVRPPIFADSHHPRAFASPLSFT